MHDIFKTIEFEEYIINIFNVTSSDICNENINCIYKADGSILWFIESIRFKDDNCPYVNIFINENKLYAVSYDGWTEEIDIKTGKIINSKFTK